MIALFAVVLFALGIVALVIVGSTAMGRVMARAAHPPPAPEPARWHLPTGYVLAALGIAIWTVVTAVVEPTAAGVYADMLALDPRDRVRPGETERLAMFGREARWAAILLAAGGLVLLARTLRRRRAVVVGVVAWVGADLALDSAGVAGADAVVAGLAVGGGMLALTGRPRTGQTVPAGLLSLVYSGASITAAFPLVMAVGPWMADQLPSWTVALVTAQAALLVAAGAAVALAAAPTPTRRTAGDAFTAAILGAGAAALHSVWEFAAGDESLDGRAFLPSVAAVAVVLVLLARACARPHPGDWWIWLMSVVPVAVLGVVLVAAAWAVLTVMQFIAGESLRQGAVVGLFLEGPLYLLPGAVAGAFLGVLSLAPVAWSYRRRIAVPEPEPAAPPRPVALPGVAEILEWNPDRTSEQPVLEPHVIEQLLVEQSESTVTEHTAEAVLDLDVPPSH